MVLGCVEWLRGSDRDLSEGSTRRDTGFATRFGVKAKTSKGLLASRSLPLNTLCNFFKVSILSSVSTFGHQAQLN